MTHQEHSPEQPSVPRRGRFAALCASFPSRGSGALPPGRFVGAFLAAAAFAATLLFVTSLASAATIPLIEETFATEVGSTTAALYATVNPRGEGSAAHFEYITEKAERENLEEGRERFFGAVQAPASGQIALGSEVKGITVSREISGLEPSTAYRFRVVAENESTHALARGPATDLTTQRPAGPESSGCSNETIREEQGAAYLPDCRAYEKVSPAEKNGWPISRLDTGPFSPITPFQYQTLSVATDGGQAVSFGDNASFGEEAEVAGAPTVSTYVATRTASGWEARNASPPLNNGTYQILAPPFLAFLTPDLATGLFAGAEVANGTPYTPPGIEAVAGLGNQYIENTTTGALRAILTESNSAASGVSLPIVIRGATSDLSRVLVQSHQGLFEWSAATGQLDAVSLLPGASEPVSQVRFGGAGTTGPVEEHSSKVDQGRAFSSDGSRAVFSVGEGGSEALYMRVGIGSPGAETVQLDGAEGGSESGGGHFQTASTDDSRIFFTDTRDLTGESAGSQDLYEYDIEKPAGERLTDLTPSTLSPEGVQLVGLSGISEDGSYFYFVSNAKLTPAATPGDCRSEGGSCNLYLDHEGSFVLVARIEAADGEPFIAGHSTESSWSFGLWDAHDWGPYYERTTRLAVGGRRLLFMSRASLTGYDNHGPRCEFYENISQVLQTAPGACEEVYLYESPSGHLACLSCNPTGGVPSGPSAVPPAEGTGEATQGYQPRALSEAGDRAYFDSLDSLSPRDRNHQRDVYEWEEDGVGSCRREEGDSAGCLELISSGQGSTESSFLDATPEGESVFFVTGDRLLSSDTDELADLYVAREGGGFAGEAAHETPCEGEEACRAAAQAPPSSATPGTPLFKGPEEGPNHAEKRKPTCHKGFALEHGHCVKKKAHKHHKRKAHRKHRRAGANRGGQK